MNTIMQKCVISGEPVLNVGSLKEVKEGQADGCSMDIGVVHKDYLKECEEHRAIIIDVLKSMHIPVTERRIRKSIIESVCPDIIGN